MGRPREKFETRINFHAMDRIDPIPWEERIESLFF